MATTMMVLIGGGIRWYYNARIAEHGRQKNVVERLSTTKTSVMWSYVGPDGLAAWELFDGPAFRRPTHAYCDGVADEEFADVAMELARLEIRTLLVLARQIVPRAEAKHSGAGDLVIEALHRHGTLRQLVVDASIRGTPPEHDAPIYTRKDLALLEAVLPNLEIVWIEVN